MPAHGDLRDFAEPFQDQSEPVGLGFVDQIAELPNDRARDQGGEQAERHAAHAVDEDVIHQPFEPLKPARAFLKLHFGKFFVNGRKLRSVRAFDLFGLRVRVVFFVFHVAIPLI